MVILSQNKDNKEFFIGMSKKELKRRVTFGRRKIS